MKTEDTQAIAFLDDFFRDRFFRWWQQVHEVHRIRLFNLAATPIEGGVKLDRLANLFWPDKPGEAEPDAIDHLYTEMMEVRQERGGASGAAAYLALLANAADQYITKFYAKEQAKE